MNFEIGIYYKVLIFLHYLIHVQDVIFSQYSNRRAAQKIFFFSFIFLYFLLLSFYFIEILSFLKSPKDADLYINRAKES